MAPEAVRQAVGGGCQIGWGRLLSVTTAIEAGLLASGDHRRRTIQRAIASDSSSTIDGTGSSAVQKRHQQRLRRHHQRHVTRNNGSNAVCTRVLADRSVVLKRKKN